MHELSIVMSIIDIAEKQARKANAQVIEEIELEIGLLSGIEMNALDFAWSQAVKHTILANAKRTINTIKGLGYCMDCNAEFEVNNYYDACPVCKQHFINILKGKELRVKSLVVA